MQTRFSCVSSRLVLVDVGQLVDCEHLLGLVMIQVTLIVIGAIVVVDMLRASQIIQVLHAAFVMVHWKHVLRMRVQVQVGLPLTSLVLRLG